MMVVTWPALLNSSPAIVSSDTLMFWAFTSKLTICGKCRSDSAHHSPTESECMIIQLIMMKACFALGFMDFTIMLFQDSTRAVMSRHVWWCIAARRRRSP